MSVSQSRRVAERPLEEAQHEPAPAAVQFVLRRACVQAYAMVSTEAGRRIAFEKMAWSNNAWRLTLELAPGTYRYRFYISDGASTAYFSPADAGPVGRRTRMEGIDGLFDVVPIHPHSPHAASDPEPIAPSLRPGISSLPIPCEGAFF